MKAEILVIGDEILIGQVQDTNSGWLCTELNILGFEVSRITVVQDRSDSLLQALEEVKGRVPVVILTGGLGPTRDDLTKQTFCTFLKSELRFDNIVYDHLEKLLRTYDREVNQLTRKQAEVPDSAEILLNFCGTAPGFWMENGSTVYIALPGVPFEMKEMFQKQVEPRLTKRFKTPFNIHRTLLTEGIAESDLAGLLEEWELGLPENIRLAYLPKLGTVRLRLSGVSADKLQLESEIEKELGLVLPLIKEYYKGMETIPEEIILGNMLIEKGLSLSLAESCTGGYLSHLITSIPGSSKYFIGSLISYSNEVKFEKLGISRSSIEAHGAVSKEVAMEMAEHARTYFHTDLAVGITGIAGPGGATETKPVGLVFIAVNSVRGTVVNQFKFRSERNGNISRASKAALNMLIKEILG